MNDMHKAGVEYDGHLQAVDVQHKHICSPPWYLTLAGAMLQQYVTGVAYLALGAPKGSHLALD